MEGPTPRMQTCVDNSEKPSSDVKKHPFSLHGQPEPCLTRSVGSNPISNQGCNSQRAMCQEMVMRLGISIIKKPLSQPVFIYLVAAPAKQGAVRGWASAMTV